MEDKTLLYYQTEANNYFDSTYHTKLTNLWKIALDIIPSGASILDLGCGSGRDTLFFSSRSSITMGLDYSFNLARLAYNFSNRPIVQADLRNIPFSKESFNIVWSVGSLLHLKKVEIHTSLLEIKRILKQDGSLFTSIKKGVGEGISKDGRFFAYYEENEWKNILIDSGFVINRVYVSNEERREKNSNEVITIPWIFSISQKKGNN